MVKGQDFARYLDLQCILVMQLSILVMKRLILNREHEIN
jgi:hypothetical protein